MELFKNGKLREHYRNPRNAGCMENADGTGRSMNPVSGDVIEIYLKIEAGWIVDARFKSFGSPAPIAGSSMLTETVKGRKIDERTPRTTWYPLLFNKLFQISTRSLSENLEW